MKKLYRIKKNEEFSALIKKRHSVASDVFIIYFADRKQDNARAGISVSKKLGNAVTRNRIKRQVREMIRALIDFDNTDKDIVVIVRNNYLNNDFNNNRLIYNRGDKYIQ